MRGAPFFHKLTPMVIFDFVGLERRAGPRRSAQTAKPETANPLLRSFPDHIRPQFGAYEKMAPLTEPHHLDRDKR